MAKKRSLTTRAMLEFDRRLRELQGSGMSRDQAIAAVAKNDPELHRQYLMESNPDVDPSVFGSASDEGEGDAIGRFTAAVEARMAAGSSRDNAIAAVVAQDPELHRAYLRATNPAADAAIFD